MSINTISKALAQGSNEKRPCKNGTSAEIKQGTPVQWDRSEYAGLAVQLCDGTGWMADFAGVLEKDIGAAEYAANGLIVEGACRVNFTGHASAAQGSYCKPADNGAYFVYTAEKTPFILLEDMTADTDSHLVEDDNGALIFIDNRAFSLRLVEFSLGSPALGVAEEIVANAIAVTSTTTVATLAGQPDVARNLQIDANSSATLADVSSGSIAIAGTNIHGESISENVSQAANSSGPWQSTLAYLTVTSITFPAQDGTGAAFEVKRGAKLGLPATLTSNRVLLATLAGVAESTQPTVTTDADEVEKNLIQLNSALAGTAVKVVLAL